MVVARYIHGQLTVIDRLRESVRLGSGMDEEGRLDREVAARALACLERFGALDEALAALDAADLPDALRSSRDRMLRERTSAP